MRNWRCMLFIQNTYCKLKILCFYLKVILCLQLVCKNIFVYIFCKFIEFWTKTEAKQENLNLSIFHFYLVSICLVKKNGLSHIHDLTSPRPPPHNISSQQEVKFHVFRWLQCIEKRYSILVSDFHIMISSSIKPPKNILDMHLRWG